MPGRKSYLEKLKELEKEILYELSLRGDEFIKARLQWEDWEMFLPRLVSFARQEIRRRRWRGQRSGVLPDGYDANSIAAEVIAGALRGEARLAVSWSFERLEKELQRRVSNEVRRLHKMKETTVMRSQCEVLSPNAENEPTSVFARMKATGSSESDAEVADAQAKEKRKAEVEIGKQLGGDDPLVRELFICLCEGVVKRREIASRLGIRVEEVTNCRKRLNRKLGDF